MANTVTSLIYDFPIEVLPDFTTEDEITISGYRDGVDSYSIQITSTGGSTFSGGVIQTTLKALVFKGDEEVDINGDDPNYSYQWYLNNEKITAHGTNKTLSVNLTDTIKNKYVYQCEVSKQ